MKTQYSKIHDEAYQFKSKGSLVAFQHGAIYDTTEIRFLKKLHLLEKKAIHHFKTKFKGQIMTLTEYRMLIDIEFNIYNLFGGTLIKTENLLKSVQAI